MDEGKRTESVDATPSVAGTSLDGVVSTLLPAPAAETLVNAMRRARKYSLGSIARQKVLQKAICDVKAEYGAYFRKDDDCSK